MAFLFTKHASTHVHDLAHVRLSYAAAGKSNAWAGASAAFRPLITACMQSACKKTMLPVPLFESACMADSLDLHSVCCSAICVVRSHAYTDIPGMEENHHVLSSLLIPFCQMTALLSCRVSRLRALNISYWMPPARPWGCAPASPTTPPSWTSCRSSHYVTAWHECLKLSFHETDSTCFMNLCYIA